MNLTAWILKRPWLYRLWQAPFAEKKLAPLYAHDDLLSIHRVLDVGCGPGTNAAHFRHTEYVGVDVNEQYVKYASRKCAGTFISCDATRKLPLPHHHFDFVLVNSLLHHLDAEEASVLLEQLRGLTASDGYLHVIDLVLPSKMSLARRLAVWDRGKFARSMDDWIQLIRRSFDLLTVEQFTIGVLGFALWHMFHMKARPRVD